MGAAQTSSCGVFCEPEGRPRGLWGVPLHVRGGSPPPTALVGSGRLSGVLTFQVHPDLSGEE